MKRIRCCQLPAMSGWRLHQRTHPNDAGHELATSEWTAASLDSQSVTLSLLTCVLSVDWSQCYWSADAAELSGWPSSAEDGQRRLPQEKDNVPAGRREWSVNPTYRKYTTISSSIGPRLTAATWWIEATTTERCYSSRINMRWKNSEDFWRGKKHFYVGWMHVFSSLTVWRDMPLLSLSEWRNDLTKLPLSPMTEQITRLITSITIITWSLFASDHD